MARATVLSLPRRIGLAAAARRCFALSYRAEPRPETPGQIAARHDAFADAYRARYAPELSVAACAAGITLEGDTLVDARTAEARSADVRRLRQLLRRSHRRAAARWLRQTLLYRGWLPYLIAKLHRARAPIPAAAPQQKPLATPVQTLDTAPHPVTNLRRFVPLPSEKNEATRSGPHGLAVRTAPSHGAIPGSIPGGVTL